MKNNTFLGGGNRDDNELGRAIQPRMKLKWDFQVVGEKEEGT